MHKHKIHRNLNLNANNDRLGVRAAVCVNLTEWHFNIFGPKNVKAIWFISTMSLVRIRFYLNF